MDVDAYSFDVSILGDEMMDTPRKRAATGARVVSFPGTGRAERAAADEGRERQLLDMILNNMSQGVLMFDADARLVFCNQGYVEMYGMSPEMVGAGYTLRDLINHGVATGTFTGEPDEYIEKLLADLAKGKTSNDIIKTKDGRTFSIVNKPLSGGGWLATHEDITERQRTEERIVHMARHDALTELPNRVLLRERLEHELKRVKRGEMLAVLCLDLDRFKSVNDTLGHPVGDELLKVVADRLRGCTREPDTIARLGGDEFAIIMTAIQQPTDAAALARRIRESIVKPFHLDGHQIVVDISIGISVAPLDATTPDQLLKNADMALYGAKGDGRGVYRFFEPEMDARMKARRDLEMDLRNALMNNEFELYYQPLVNLETNEITSFEALLRWHHPKRGTISPAEFIPIAEETGLIIPVGEWVLRTACLETAKWPKDVKVAVNLSPAQLKARNVVEVVISALEESGLPAKRLQLEITESVLMHNTFGTLATLHKLRELGVQIAMDDFGTGYSSLSYLRSFPFDKIKIDRSFIQDISSAAEPLAIVHAVAGLAKCLNMVSTAEGVETRQQMETLQNVGCTEMQGYFFSKAKPAAEIVEDFLKPGANLVQKDQVLPAKAKK
jgi:diguanylate cyclase (GGDEF)-like protein/PAS domain S-box-containing protein